MIAIDPGSSGGIAVLHHDGVVRAFKMPDTEGDVLERLRTLRDAGLQLVVMEDQAGVYLPKGVVSAAAMFTFGRGFGFLVGVCQTLGFRIELVRAQKWQGALSLGNSRSCDSKTEWKNKLKAKAQQLNPDIKVTLDIADALLLLEYAMLTHPLVANLYPRAKAEQELALA